MPKGVIYLTPEQEARRDQLGLEAGLKGAAIGLGIGALGFIMVTRRSAEFRALSRPMQAIMPTAATVSGYLFASDRATSAYENANLGYTDEDLLMQLHDGDDQVKKTGFLAYLNENRWSVIGLSWAASMVGALGYSFSNRYLTTQQKVVQARMYAQAVTLAVLMASAGLSIYMGEDKKPKDLPDAQLRAVLELPVEENKRVSNTPTTTSTKQPMN